jgi:diphosphomevalonate decarboxylase
MNFSHTATALAHPNIALIKYWGNRDANLRLPSNGSISMNLEGLETSTTVTFSGSHPEDSLEINGQLITGLGLSRVSAFLNIVRQMAGIDLHATVTSRCNFPLGVGIASSAAAFAALAKASALAARLNLDETDLSRLARKGSGSACRSVPTGFVEWLAGKEDADSFAVSIAPPEHWDLVDCIALLSSEQKTTGSTEGHALASTSPLQATRVLDAPRRLEICRSAILQRDFLALADIVELDSDMMHAVMMTSRPPLFYWQGATLTTMQVVREKRATGLAVFYTIDAGPNVHVITELDKVDQVTQILRDLPCVKEVLCAPVGGPTREI